MKIRKTMSNDYMDFIEHGKVSNCCFAQVALGDICLECKEHCEAIDEDEEQEERFNTLEAEE